MAEIDNERPPVEVMATPVFHDAYQYFENRFGVSANCITRGYAWGRTCCRVREKVISLDASGKAIAPSGFMT